MLVKPAPASKKGPFFPFSSDLQLFSKTTRSVFSKNDDNKNNKNINKPWFWSDQYDLKLQIAGLFHGYDHVVFRGVMADRAFAAFYYKGDKLIAVDAVNRPAEYLGAKMLIQTNRTLPPNVIEDMSRPMKELVASAR